MGVAGGVEGWVFVLFCWQVVHPAIYAQMNEARPGHQNSAVTN